MIFILKLFEIIYKKNVNIGSKVIKKFIKVIPSSFIIYIIDIFFRTKKFFYSLVLLIKMVLFLF
jgi:hypothetical protein